MDCCTATVGSLQRGEEWPVEPLGNLTKSTGQIWCCRAVVEVLRESRDRGATVCAYTGLACCAISAASENHMRIMSEENVMSHRQMICL